MARAWEEGDVVVSTLGIIGMDLGNVPDDKHDLSMPVDDILHVQTFKVNQAHRPETAKSHNSRTRTRTHDRANFSFLIRPPNFRFLLSPSREHATLPVASVLSTDVVSASRAFLSAL